MPVVAIVAAVAIDAAAAGSIAAIAAGAFTAVDALAAVSALGATLGAIGTVTGNKNLTMAGAALGVVGGVGALAVNAGVFGADAASSLFGSDAGAAGNATGGIGDAVPPPDAVTTEDLPPPGAPTAAADAGGTTNAVTATGSVNQAAANPVGAINSTSIAPAEGNATAIETGGQTDTALSSALKPPVTTEALPGSVGTAPTPVSGATLTGNASGVSLPPPGSFQPGWAINPSSPGIQPLGVSGEPNDASQIFNFGSSNSQGILGDLMSWGKANPMVAYGLVQSGGSLISGLTNPVTPAQISALDAQAAANRAAAALAQNQINAVAMPKSTVSAAPVTGAPAGSLINGQVPTTPLVGAASPNPLIKNTPTNAAVTGAPI